MVASSSCSDLDLECFWNIEEAGVSMAKEHSQNNTLQQYLSSMTRADDGAYFARFPWKPNHKDTDANAPFGMNHSVKNSMPNGKSLQIASELRCYFQSPIT